ncbi:hypothetical protein [Qipengyuania seohaensis]|uniref:hypothetical protein n=1 Tax=Qipengyuania seohaensis TaxID=266951 RepID=UPI0012FD466D|nr:hypothetical protein [Qipengyuania seohaensis]
MADQDTVARRFWVIQMARLSAFVMVFIGALIVSKIIDLPDFVGYIILVIGLAEFFVVPMVLSKRWKSGD